jgi:hypothetical protein
MPTNDERGEHGRMILDSYGAMFGDPYDPITNLTDVLADLMHTAVKQPELRLKCQDRLRMAMMHYEAETEEDD